MEQNEEYINLFEHLKKIRLDKNISLETISRDSRIQISYLKALEAGEFEKIPEVYDKLFFQTYISYLNLEDPEKYLNEFKGLRKEIFYPTPTTTIRRIKTTNVKNHPFFNLKTLFVLGPIILIAAIISFMAINSETVGSNTNDPVKELPVRKIVENIEAKEKAMNDSLDQKLKSNSEILNLTVGLKALERTWVRFIKDKRDTSEYMLYNGNTITINADSTLQFLVGNAAGVEFIINNENKGVLGKPGEVISYLKITNNGIIEKRMKLISNSKVSNDSISIN